MLTFLAALALCFIGASSWIMSYEEFSEHNKQNGWSHFLFWMGVVLIIHGVSLAYWK